MEYNIREHRHRFASWAAARAAQRGFTNTKNIIEAINSTDIRKTVETKSLWPKRKSDFERLHRQWCTQIISTLRKLGVKSSYGRAAKIVAIYFKIAIILSDNERSVFGKIIHPPVDRILLSSLNIKQNWTTLSEEKYFLVMKKLKEINGNKAFWEIECNWKPE
jgi:hypothetical protein